MGDIIGGVGRALQEGARQSLDARAQADQLAGFSDAAGIALRRIRSESDALKQKVKDGSSLTRAEQLVLAQLDELESDLVTAYNYYWKRTGLDWRPRVERAVVPKGSVIRRPVESSTREDT